MTGWLAALTFALLAPRAVAAPAGRAAAPPADVAEGARRALVQPLADAEIDWEAGTVTARGGAAANLSLPGPDAARPAARRDAEKRARERLGEALRALPLGGGRKPGASAVAAALDRARIKDVEYQSNGGVLLSLEARFADVGAPAPKPDAPGDAGTDAGTDAGSGGRADKQPARAVAAGARATGSAARTARMIERAAAAAAPPITIAVASMPLEAAPRVRVGGSDATLGSAVYRLGEPPRTAGALPARRDKAGRLVLTAPELSAAKLDGASAIIYVRTVARR